MAASTAQEIVNRELNSRPVVRKKKKPSRYRCRSENVLLLLTAISVFIGVGLGIGLKHLPNQLSKREVSYLNFPGEIFVRILKMLILPLVLSTITNSLSGLNSKAAGMLGLYSMIYYLSTLLLAVITGIILVLVIKPGGSGSQAYLENKNDDCRGVLPVDTILDVLRSVFPENIIAASFQSDRTCFKYFLRSGNATTILSSDMIDKLHESGNESMLSSMAEPYMVTKSGTNVMGIIAFAIFFGFMISKAGKEGEPLGNLMRSLETVTMHMVSVVIWYSPIGICFLIAAQIVGMQNLLEELKHLGLYMATVCAGLAIHGLITLPLILLAIGRQNPFKFGYGMLQALLTAFGTASSAATLPLTMKCLTDHNRMPPKLVKFMVPLGATVNMDGTALYEAVAAIYIAQSIGKVLSIGEVIIVSLTATLASIGAAGIPSAGLVTMIMVLTAVDIPAKYFALVIPVDWFLDRVRTTINVWGDCIGPPVVGRFCSGEIMEPKEHSGDAIALANLMYLPNSQHQVHPTAPPVLPKTKRISANYATGLPAKSDAA